LRKKLAEAITLCTGKVTDEFVVATTLHSVIFHCAIATDDFIMSETVKF
jgi:hypothetical protein